LAVVIGLLATLSLLPPSWHTAEAAEPTPVKIPRSADGKPDFSGIWQTTSAADYDLEPHSGLSRAGDFHDEALQIVERWKFLDANTIDYQATLEDPGIYLHRWTIEVFSYRHREANFQLIENYCYTLDYDKDYPVPKMTQESPPGASGASTSPRTPTAPNKLGLRCEEETPNRNAADLCRVLCRHRQTGVSASVAGQEYGLPVAAFLGGGLHGRPRYRLRVVH
jgi:hypothetical protein